MTDHSDGSGEPRSGFLEAVRRVNLPGRVEHSTRLRVAVLLAVLVAVASTGWSEAAPGDDAVLAFALLPVGAVVSMRRAGRPNLGLKGLLAVGALLALFRFFDDLRAIEAIELARQPLASLFLSVQVLHGFDLPARRDLGFTLASSLTLIALSASNTFAMWFLAILVVYGILGVVAMLEMQRSAARQRADEWRERDDLAPFAEPDAGGVAGGRQVAGATPAESAVGRRDLLAMVKVGMVVVLLGALAFSVVPRSSTTRLGGLQFNRLPFSLPIPTGMINNPGLAGEGQDVPVEGLPALDYNPAAYFGFAQHVDLRTVGTPTDLPVLRVRADRPRLWRGMVFDTYTGIGWSRPGEDAAPPGLSGRPIRVPVSIGEGNDFERVVQTVELLTDTPNLIFAAAQAQEIHVGGSVVAWGDGTLSTNASLVDGTVYSIVSRVNVTPRPVLRRVPGGWSGVDLDRWTQLPASVPQRVHDLAREITAGVDRPYEVAEAIQAWLGANTEYTLEAMPPPLAGDVVDHFLFDTRQGWCEPIAASMVVLLRSVGVPARFATGFQPGSRNPVTGMFDVKMENAHAWVEVNVPGHGWLEFDPTGAVPQAVSPDPHRSIPLLDLLRWAGERLVPEPVANVLSAGADRVREQWLAALLVVASLAAGGVLLARSRREAAWRTRPVFEQLERLLASDGLHRAPGQTPRQFIDEVARRRAQWPREALDRVLAAEEARRYDGPEVSPQEASRAVDELREALSR